jgi:hypothetical protein
VAKIKTIETLRDVEAALLPNGTSIGVWNGHDVTVTIRGRKYHMATEYGISETDHDCVVKVNGVVVEVDHK